LAFVVSTMVDPADLDKNDPDSDAVPREPQGAMGSPPSSLPSVNPGIDWIEDADFDRYERKRPIGKGSMGEVHLCKDGRIGREVAMKVILPDHRADAQLRARFLREARVQGQLEHPSIVPVYDLGVNDNGGTYFTMKRLRGLTLAEILRRLQEGDAEVTRHFSRRKLLTTFSSVCLTIDFAHSRGVLHRDLKPSNVMLGDFGEVYVLDWGIAKLTSGGQEPAGSVEFDQPGAEIETAAGKALGTFGYMSPEQVLGKIVELDARTDVYALGAILFEILTLSPLHPRTTWSAMLASTLNGGPARPSIRAPESDVPPELEQICVKATMVDPKDRYSSARELNEAVERFLDGDRDIELRRQMVVEHAQAAREAAARVIAGGDDAEEARRTALSNVGRTLTLDPSNRTAIRALGKVIAARPAKLPREVTEELERGVMARYRLLFQEGIRFDLIGALLIGPLSWWMGIRDATLLIGAVACILISMLFKVAGVRRRTPDGWAPYVGGAYLFNVLGLLAVSRGFGPFFLTPALLAVIAFAYSMSHTTRYRIMVMVTAVLSLLGPVLGELAGIIPRSYAFQGGVMTILPQAVSLPEGPTLFALTVANLFMIVGPGLIMGKLQSSIRKAEKRSILQAWHLQQLIPDEARPGLRGKSWSRRPLPASRSDQRAARASR
jgi:eukaryotic-like serine/threonine-protein kinase